MEKIERYTNLCKIVNAVNIISKYTTENIESSVIGTLSANNTSIYKPVNEKSSMSVWMSCQSELFSITRC